MFLFEFTFLVAWWLILFALLTNNLVEFLQGNFFFSFNGIIVGKVPGVVDGVQKDPGDLPGHITCSLTFAELCGNEEAMPCDLAGGYLDSCLRWNQFRWL